MELKSNPGSLRKIDIDMLMKVLDAIGVPTEMRGEVQRLWVEWSPESFLTVDIKYSPSMVKYHENRARKAESRQIEGGELYAPGDAGRVGDKDGLSRM